MASWTYDRELGLFLRFEPTAEQRAVIQAPIDRPIRLVAGAGTGKTETIASRFVWLVLRAKLDPCRILAVTFTNKAAGELERRICQALQRNNVEPPLGRLYIHTFHGLCQRVLSQHAYLAGLPGVMTILDEVGATVLLNQILENEFTLGLEDGLSDEDLKNLPFDGCSSLRKAVTALLEDARGLGWEVEDLDDAPESAPLRTFQHRFYSAVERFLDEAPPDGNQAVKTLRELLAESGIPVALPENETKRITSHRVKALMKALGYTYDKRARAYTRTVPVEVVRSACRQIRSAEQAVIEITRRIYRRYRDTLLEEGRIDFNELIQRTVRLLKYVPGVRNQYRQTFQYVLVDEFQDTSGLQAELTDLLCRRHPQTGGPANLMITGDRKQSIYIWRYARPRNLAELVRDEWVQSGKALHFSLTHNFRSAEQIISVANRLSADIEPDDKPLVPAGTQHGETYASKVFRVQKGTSITDARREEALWVAQTIRHIHDRPETCIPYQETAVLIRDRKRAFHLRKTLAQLGIPLAEAGAASFFQEPLIRDVIAYLRVIADPHDDAAMCRILERPPVSLSDREIYLLGTTPHRSDQGTRAPAHLFTGLIRRVAGRADPLVTDSVPLESVELVARRLTNWIERRSLLTAERLVEEIVRTSGILSCPSSDDLQGWPAAYALLCSLARSLSAAGLDERVHTFVELLHLYQANEKLSLSHPVVTEDHGVHVLTIHQAKGLEFGACFALGLKEPSQHVEWGLDEDWGLVSGKYLDQDTIKSAAIRAFRKIDDEERRIAYVACTRAKHLLVTSHTTRSEDEKHPYGEYFGETPEEPGTLSIAESIERATPAFLQPIEKAVYPSKPSAIETSFSALELVATCPTAYWITRRWCLPEWFGRLGDVNQPAYGPATGRVFHDLVAKFYTARWSGKPFDPHERISSHLRMEGLDPDGPVARNVEALWDAFADSEWASRNPAPSDVERPVRWVTLLRDGTLVSIRGRIDLVDRDSSGRPAVKDFKTKTPVTSDDLDVYAVQGLLYLRALGRQVEPAEDASKRTSVREKESLPRLGETQSGLKTVDSSTPPEPSSILGRANGEALETPRPGDARKGLSPGDLGEGQPAESVSKPSSMGADDVGASPRGRSVDSPGQTQGSAPTERDNIGSFETVSPGEPTESSPDTIPPSVIVVTRAGVEEISLGPRLTHADRILEERIYRLVEIEAAGQIPDPQTDAPCYICSYGLLCPRSSARTDRRKE